MPIVKLRIMDPPILPYLTDFIGPKDIPNILRNWFIDKSSSMVDGNMVKQTSRQLIGNMVGRMK